MLEQYCLFAAFLPRADEDRQAYEPITQPNQDSDQPDLVFAILASLEFLIHNQHSPQESSTGAKILLENKTAVWSRLPHTLIIDSHIADIGLDESCDRIE